MGFTIKGNEVKIYADSTLPTVATFSGHDNYFKESAFMLGMGGGGTYIDADYHRFLMADHAFNEAEIRAVFKAFKKREYKKINDVLGLSGKAVVGMVKTDEDGLLEQVETYPRWGREKNPYANQKHFLGWFLTDASTGFLPVPNIVGSGRMRINLYAQATKGNGIVKTIPSEMVDFSTVPPNSLAVGICHATSNTVIVGLAFDGIRRYVTDTKQGHGIVLSQAWLGVELEPIADDDRVDNLDY